MKMNWTGSSYDYIKNYLRTMIAVNAEIAAKCIRGAFQKKILTKMRNAWELRRAVCGYLFGKRRVWHELSDET